MRRHAAPPVTARREETPRGKDNQLKLSDFVRAKMALSHSDLRTSDNAKPE